MGRTLRKLIKQYDEPVPKRNLRKYDITIWEAIGKWHIVRQFTDKAVKEEALEALQECIRALSAEFGLKLSLHANEELQLWLGTTLSFSSGIENFILFAGPYSSKATEQVGCYGVNLLLLAQREGISTWWIGGTYNMKKMEGETGGELYGVIVFGYGREEGKPHRPKSVMRVNRCRDNEPEWFSHDIEAALLAPTTMSKQVFMIMGKDAVVQVSYKAGAFSDAGRGIIKYFLKQDAGKESFHFADAE